MLSIVVSLYFGLKGVFIDLYNPGSLVAKHYSDIVTWIFVGTVLLSIPLLIEKFQRISKWHDKLDTTPTNKQSALIWTATKPIIKWGLMIVALAFIISIILQWYLDFVNKQIQY